MYIYIYGMYICIYVYMYMYIYIYIYACGMGSFGDCTTHTRRSWRPSLCGVGNPQVDRYVRDPEGWMLKHT